MRTVDLIILLAVSIAFVLAEDEPSTESTNSDKTSKMVDDRLPTSPTARSIRRDEARSLQAAGTASTGTRPSAIRKWLSTFLAKMKNLYRKLAIKLKLKKLTPEGMAQAQSKQNAVKQTRHGEHHPQNVEKPGLQKKPRLQKKLTPDNVKKSKPQEKFITESKTKPEPKKLTTENVAELEPQREYTLGNVKKPKPQEKSTTESKKEPEPKVFTIDTAVWSKQKWNYKDFVEAMAKADNPKSISDEMFRNWLRDDLNNHFKIQHHMKTPPNVYENELMARAEKDHHNVQELYTDSIKAYKKKYAEDYPPKPERRDKISATWRLRQGYKTAVNFLTKPKAKKKA